MFQVHSIIALIVVGVIAGWLAGKIVTGRGFGFLGDMVVGIAGAFAGAWLFDFFGIFVGGGWLAAIFSATVGAVVLLGLIKLIKRL